MLCMSGTLSMATSQSLPVAPRPGPAAFSADPQRLVDLATQIAQARATLAAWRDNLALHASAYTRSVEPLIRSLAAARRETVFRFDRLLDEPGWNQAERNALIEWLTAGANELLEIGGGGGGGGGEGDATLRALLDKHAIPHPSARRHHGEAVPPPAQDASASDAQAWSDAGRGPRRKAASADPLPRPPEHSLRDLFRKLASALHPDRETDPLQRERKTTLMQQANVAYAGGDLLTLLELQAKTLAPAEFDAGRVSSLSAEQIAHHSAALAAQGATLKADTDRAEARFRSEFGLPPGRGMNPAKLVRTVREEARELRADIAAQQAFLRLLDDPAALKQWLRHERRRPRSNEPKMGG